MPRIRTVKPDFWTDRRMVKLSPYARLFYIGMWNFALCDHGHLPDDAEELKLKILPVDDVDADALLAELIDSDRIRRCTTAEGGTFLWARKLSDHQKVDGRWQSRCPYCAEAVRPRTADSAPLAAEPQPDPPPLTETPASSGEPQRDSPELAKAHRSPSELTQEGKGKEGKGRSGGTGPYNSSGPYRARERDAPADDHQPRSMTEQLLAEHCAKQRRPPPSKERRRLAEEIHDLLVDEYTPDEIRTSLDAWSRRPLGAGALPSIASELFSRSSDVSALDRRRDAPQRQRSGVDDSIDGWRELRRQIALEGAT